MYMKYPKLILAGVFGLVLQGTASAQIYESEDAEGVPEFSDTPTQGAEAVDLPSTNLADAPPAGSAAPQEIEQAAPVAGGPAAGSVGGPVEGANGGVYYGGDDEDGVRAQRRLDEDRIDNALPGNPGPGVEAGEVHHEAGGHR
jgi:hypothetical protein